MGEKFISFLSNVKILETDDGAQMFTITNGKIWKNEINAVLGS